MDDRVRASDADRDGAAAALRGHFAAGRLDAGELDERLAAALSARTLGALHAVMADLPPAGAGELEAARDRLERGYRRLLVCYPAAWRRAHEQEMLAVLMTAAPEGKPRPGLGEATDLVAGGLRVRCQRTRDGAAPAWRDALAVLTVVLPLFVLTSTAIQEVALAFHSAIATYVGGGFGPVNSYSSLLATQLTVPLGLAAIALLRHYRVAAVTVAAAVIGLAALAGWTHLRWEYGLTSPYVLLAVVVQAGAVTASLGPRRALVLLTWKSAALTFVAAASIAVTSYPLSLVAVVVIVAAMSLSSSLGRWLLPLLAIPLWPFTTSFAIGGSIAIHLGLNAPRLLVTSSLVTLQPINWWLAYAYLIPAVLLCLFAAAASRDFLRSRRLAKPTA